MPEIGRAIAQGDFQTACKIADRALALLETGAGQPAAGGPPLATPALPFTPRPTPAPTPSPTPVPVSGVSLPTLAKVADLPGGHVADIAFAPSKPETVYLASNVNAMGIWRSDDGGETWRRVYYDMKGGATHTNNLAVHPTDPNIVLATDIHGSIAKTTNGGETWTRRVVHESYHKPLWWVTFAASNPAVAYAGGETGQVFKSTDKGDSWALMASVPVTGSGLATAVVDPRDPETLYAAGFGGNIYKSTDGAKSFSLWKELPIDPHQIVKSLALSTTDATKIFAATSQGVLVTGDGGNTWQKTLRLHANSLQVAPSADPKVVYAGTLEGVYKSTDAGRTWTKRSANIVWEDTGSLTVHPQNPDVVLMGSNIWADWTPDWGHPRPASFVGEGIYKTTNGGETWRKTGSGFKDVDVVAVAVNPLNPNEVYVGTECSRGLLRTLDGGASWEIIMTGPRGPFDIAHYTMRLAVTSDSKVWLTGLFGLAASSDHGKNWEHFLGRQHFHGIGIHPKNPQVIFVGTSPTDDPTAAVEYPEGGILYSTDGGKVWKQPVAGFPQGAHTSVHDFAFDPVDDNTVYVVTTSHEFNQPRLETTVGIYKSTDLGSTWQEVNTGLTSKEVHAIATSPARGGTLFAATEKGAFLSRDGGASWQATALREDARSVVVDPVDGRVVYVGTAQGLYWSPDGGETWQQATSVPAGWVSALALDGQGRALYAVVNDVGVYKGVRK